MTGYLFDMEFEEHAPHTHLLVDFANTFFRGTHAYSKLNQDGEFPVAHLYGPIKMILGLIKKMPGTHTLHIAMEGYPQFRYDLLPSYKEGRGGRFSDQEDEVFSLMKKDLHNALRMVPSSWYVHPDYEADDVIATLVTSLQQGEKTKNDDIWIMSSDKDLWGLVTGESCDLDAGKVFCFGNKAEEFNHVRVTEKLGVGPGKVCLHKAFFGDTSDKIPRISRVPEKLLLGILQQCDTVDQVYGLVEGGGIKLTPNQQSKFADFKGQAYTNFRVASLQKELDLECTRYEGDQQELKTYLEARKCPSLVKDLRVFWE